MQWKLVVVLLLGVSAAQAGVEVTAIDVDGAPVADVTVILGGEGSGNQTRRTMGNGKVSFDVPAGTYALVATFGSQVTPQQTVIVGDGEQKAVTVRFERDAAAEEINISEHTASRAAPARIVPDTMPRTVPYTDETIDRNVYASVWLLLYISPTGTVDKVEVLKSPHGLDLESVTLPEARKLRFEPALDHQGRPRASKVLWHVEWEPYWTKRENAFGRNRAVCAGSGPLNLDHLGTRSGVVVSYRDCEPPAGYQHLVTAPGSTQLGGAMPIRGRGLRRPPRE